MEREVTERAGAVLRALADLAAGGEADRPVPRSLLVPTEDFAWLPVSSIFLFRPGHSPSTADSLAGATQRFIASYDASGVFVEKRVGDRLAKIDQVRGEGRSLRLGWLFVAGTQRDADGKAHEVFHPLVTVPVRLHRAPFFGPERAVIGAGDAELSPLVEDPNVRHRLEGRLDEALAMKPIEGRIIERDRLEHLTALRTFARLAANAAGLPAGSIIPAEGTPADLIGRPGLRVVAGVGIYAVRDESPPRRTGALAAWFDQVDHGSTWTAFHSLYLPELLDGQGPPLAGDLAIDSPFVLDPAQRRAVARSREAPVTVVSGAPGTGKSHTIAAVACDALTRGETVLVAAKSDATVDALLDLLERSPGPDPVVFGSSERLRALAERLAAGREDAVPEGEVGAARAAWRAADDRRRRLHEGLVVRLRSDWPDAARSSELVVLGADADLDEVARRSQDARDDGDGWWAQRRRRRALEDLAELVGTPLEAGDLGGIEAAVERARRERALAAEGDLARAVERPYRELWDELAAAADAAREARGRWLEADCRSERRFDGSRRAAVAALATALRSGRAARREQLAKLKGDKLTEALPLWVGTLADIDDLLPPEAARFDLVILDEASSIDQPLAATALLRGRRAVVAGDPRQLRQVSFLGDARRDAVLAAHGLDGEDDVDLAVRLDVRRNSAFDLAAGAAPVQVLDEHFRSAPHLMEFVAHRLYDGRVHVATRSPRTESIDCIDLVRVDGARDERGVVQAEVARVVEEVRHLLPADGQASIPIGGRAPHSVGVVTPFRAQADALEEAVLAAFTADELEALDLRVGTAHAFQGNERDVVVVSLGVGAGGDANAWSFVADPHLFAVLVTRARQHQLVVSSATPPAGSLVADYLAQADDPPGRPRPVGTVGPWPREVAEDLAAGGAAVTTAYPSGRHVVDVAAGDADQAVGVVCDLHPDGPDAHIDRHLALRRQGWELVDAPESEWGDRRGELVVDLLGRLGVVAPG